MEPVGRPGSVTLFGAPMWELSPMSSSSFPALVITAMLKEFKTTFNLPNNATWLSWAARSLYAVHNLPDLQ
jgi:hypothetical protein